jgi:2,5-diketo-D-gluconate reductase B
VSVPALGFGTSGLRGDACREAVEHALTLGYRHLDTAQGYGNEREVGAGLRRSGVPRSDVWLTTKLKPEWFGAADAATQTEASLDALGVDDVDLLLLHWPNPSVPLEETFTALQPLLDAGRVRHIGVSNFTPSMTREAHALAPILVNQVEYHPYLHQRFLLDVVHDLDLLLTAYSPLAQGEVTSDPVIMEIADKHGKTPAQIALRWLLQQPRVTAIPKAASAKHREANLDVFDFNLSEDDMISLFDLEAERRLINPPFAPAWERA